MITKKKLDENDDFKNFINPSSEHSIMCLGDGLLKTARVGEVVQLERRGFFRVDQPFISASRPCSLIAVPDGKEKRDSEVKK